MDRFAVVNLFGIQGLNIAWYGVIIASGMMLGILLASLRARKRGWSSDLVLDFILLAVPLAVIGARAYYVAFEWDYFAANPERIIAINTGGLAIYGAVIGGFHLQNADHRRLEQTIEALRRIAPELIIPCHCTGEKAVELMRAELGGLVLPGHAGLRVTV